MGKKERKLVANNKKAYHDYFIEETYEAGIVLTGTEIKSVRQGKSALRRATRAIKDGRNDALRYEYQSVRAGQSL